MVIGLFPEFLSMGGIQTVGRHVAAVLARIAKERGWESSFLSLNDPAEEYESCVGDYRFHFRGLARSKHRFALQALRLSDKNTRLVVAGHPNLAVPGAAMCAKAPGIRLLVLSHGIEVWKPLSHLRRVSLKSADIVLAPSRDTARKLIEAQGMADRRIQVLPWGIDPEFLRISNWGRELPLPPVIPSAPYILSVGRWSSAEKYKGFDTLIQALPKLLKNFSDLSLVFVGEGDDRPRLQRLAAELQVEKRVQFVSGLSLEQRVATYAHADAFALPSSGEGFGLVFLEAMALGKSVIGGYHGGIPDIICDGVTGFLIPYGDVARLSEKLRLLLEDPDLRDQMGQRGRERLERHFLFEKFESGFRAVVARVCPLELSH